MKIIPSKEAFLALRKSCERVPILGEQTVTDFNPSRFFRFLYGNATHAFLFESGKGPETTARYTLMGQSNSKTLQAHNDQVIVSNNGMRQARAGSPDSALEHLYFEAHSQSFDYAPHFWGGWVGYFGYEMARWLDGVALRSKEGLDLPLLHFFQVDRIWVYDHITFTLKMIVSEDCQDDPEKHYEKTVQEIQQCWQTAKNQLNGSKPTKISSASPVSNGNGSSLRPNISRQEYRAMVQRAKFYIEEGDIYQANLARRFDMKFAGDPLDLYDRLRQINPSPVSGFMKLGDMALVSSSPERLIKVERGILETRPIAGTRPRGKNAQEDECLTTELLLNEKELAEHLMLVDLERNDLGRICQYGSVKVTEQMGVEQYSHVSHIVSNIRGILKPGITLKEILKAVFPGGTITGCPKIRCMEIIDELEPVTRGPYSGSFGYIGFGGTLDLNIIIRTILVKDKKAYFHVGAGIVADSIPEKEYQETLDKAAAMINVLTEPRKL